MGAWKICEVAESEPPFATVGLNHSLLVTVNLEREVAAVRASLVPAKICRQAGLSADDALVELRLIPDLDAQIS